MWFVLRNHIILGNKSLMIQTHNKMATDLVHTWSRTNNKSTKIRGKTDGKLRLSKPGTIVKGYQTNMVHCSTKLRDHIGQ